jgi:hypothetical protein
LTRISGESAFAADPVRETGGKRRILSLPGQEDAVIR